MRRKKSNGFTLMELLVTVSVLAIVVSIAIPRWYEATERSRLAGCKQNLHSYATALQVYSNFHDSRYPQDLTELPPDFLRTMAPCPAAGSDTYTEGYEVNADRTGYTLHCSGQNHGSMNLPADEPYYTPDAGLSN